MLPKKEQCTIDNIWREILVIFAQELETSTKKFLVIGNCEVIQKRIKKQPILKKNNVEW
jgi:hypothetical protein